MGTVYQQCPECLCTFNSWSSGSDSGSTYHQDTLCCDCQSAQDDDDDWDDWDD
jgi:hypothetical protein